MHGDVWNDLLDRNITKFQEIFASYGDVDVNVDFKGRTFVVTDSPDLKFLKSTKTLYYTLGLTTDAVIMSPNVEEDSILDRSAGNENIAAVYQSQWAYTLRIKGYSYLLSAPPSDAALKAPTSWGTVATDTKDTAGVGIAHQGILTA